MIRFGRLVTASVAVALLAPAAASAEDFDPSDEFALKDWVPIHLGPIDMSINKAVVYLFVGAGLSILIGILTMRWKLSVRAGTRQTVGEVVYEIAQVQVAETGLPTKAMPRWFPYCGALLIFIFVVNLLGFIPLPFTGQTYHGVPVWGIYAATSSISVTLALAFLTWVAQHVEGIRYNGAIK